MYLAYEQILQASTILAGAYGIGGFIGEFERTETPRALLYCVAIEALFLLSALFAAFKLCITMYFFTAAIAVTIILSILLACLLHRKLKIEKYLVDELEKYFPES